MIVSLTGRIAQSDRVGSRAGTRAGVSGSLVDVLIEFCGELRQTDGHLVAVLNLNR